MAAIETAHAVAEEVDGFMRRLGVEEGLQLRGAFGDPTGRTEAGNQDAVARRP